MPLVLPTLVICNTPDEVLAENIRVNSSREYAWLRSYPAHNTPAVFIGGGPSVADHVDDIKRLADAGAVVFAMNGASRWAREQGIMVHFQVIADAKKETATLVDPDAHDHLFASQCHPDTFASAQNPILWHLELGSIESLLDVERVRKGGYVLIGGGASVGNSALCIGYAKGFREMHVFGYDSCNRGDATHAYPQPMNENIPHTIVKWAGKSYTASVAMKAQAEKFQLTAQALKQMGCELFLYGEGLLQTMYNTRPEHLSEQEKYQLMWQFDAYRDYSPGEGCVEHFLRIVKPDDMVIDFGCGTGRAGIQLSEKGVPVLLTDFTDNCRDDEALHLPFLQWDLTRPCPAASKFGLCTDVLEHIPPEDIETVIYNIMDAAETVYFQVSTVQDKMGDLIGKPLHLTVRPFDWWAEMFGRFGTVFYSEHQTETCIFVVKR